MDQPADGVHLGRLGRTVGLEGGLLFHAAGPVEADLLEAGTLLWVEGLGETVVRDLRSHPRGIVLFLRGVRRVESARQLVNARVLLERARLPEGLDELSLNEGTTGLPVTLIDPAGNRELGTVQGTAGSPGHELLIVARPASRSTFMLPLSAPYVKLDHTGVQVIDPPDGLLPD
jgi:ribosomal 30S subunit maturation factor RimM